MLPPNPTNIHDLIAAHTAAWARLTKTCQITDSVAAKLEGRVITTEDQQLHDEADDAESAAITGIISAVPIRIHDYRRKLEYLRMIIRDGWVDAENIDLLLTSLIEFSPCCPFCEDQKAVAA